MKDFLKYTLATMLGIILTGIFAIMMSTVMILSMMVAGNSQPAITKSSVLRINLSGTLEERASDNPLSEFLGSSTLSSQGLDDMLAAIREAKTNDKVKGIYIEGGAFVADFASLEELRKALADFKASKKFVIAYADNYTEGCYYVASVADKVLINPSGMLDWHGIASQPIFYKDLLEKIGVKMQVFKVGTYKSAVEPYILTGMSEANREQVTSFITDIWNGICQQVGKSRKITTDSLNAYADRYTPLADTKEYKRMRLVDDLVYIDSVRTMLRKMSGESEVNFVTPRHLAALSKQEGSDNEVAIYYAYGSIVDVSSQNRMGTESEIVGSKVVADLDKLMNDEAVKAVVLRINSGGGSAYASEQMWRAIQLLRAKKPVVVSMGGMAASGGYYMACGANYIMAEPTTLTGSIGIFGLVPDVSGLLTEKLGLHFDVVKTNQASDFGNPGRPFNAGEAAAMQAYVDRGYKLFINRVAAGRKMKPEAVDKIGQGRVWTGNQAVKIGLVDKLGTLEDAVAEAAHRAKLSDYAVTTHPAPPSWLDNLKDIESKDYLEERLRIALGAYYQPLMFVTSLNSNSYLQARIPFDPNLK